MYADAIRIKESSCSPMKSSKLMMLVTLLFPESNLQVTYSPEDSIWPIAEHLD